jgi:general secretion pathway protein F
MPHYAYRAATLEGQTLRGVVDVASAAELERDLSARGLLLLEAAPTRAPNRQATSRFRRRRADVVEAIRYLASLLEAGFPLDRALGTVTKVVRRADVAGALDTVRERVRSGAPLADALAEQPTVFPRLAFGMARAGEQGGHLPQALKDLAEHLEREERLRSEVVSALFYPVLVAVTGSAAVLALVLYVLPRFVDVLGDMGAALPRSTAILLATGAFFGRWWLLLVPVAVAVTAVGAAYRRSEGGREATDTLLLRVPVVGALRQQSAAARLGRSLSTLLKSGLPILPSLDMAAHSLTDAAVAREVHRAREEVRAGARLAPALSRGTQFPYLFLQMVEIGEEGGLLPEMLERAATAAEQELQRGLDRLVRLIEPVMIIVFGGAAGFVALSLLQAIYGIRLDAL